jgi:hypothetical protein
MTEDKMTVIKIKTDEIIVHKIYLIHTAMFDDIYSAPNCIN